MVQKVWHLQGNLKEVMSSMTHREYLTRLAWIEENYKDPSREDYYAMRIAQEVRRVLSKKPNDVKITDFKVEFGKQPKPDPQKAVDASKAFWFGALGLPMPKPNNIEE